MRITILAGLVGAGLAMMTLPAEAAWKSYISKPLGFSFEAPGDLKTEKGTYEGALGGKKEAIVYRSVDDNIEYKAMVVDFTRARPKAPCFSEKRHSCSRTRRSSSWIRSAASMDCTAASSASISPTMAGARWRGSISSTDG